MFYTRFFAKRAVQVSRKFSGHSVDEAAHEAAKWTKYSYGKKIYCAIII